MTDVLTPEQRHLNMSRIRNKDTRPELFVRSFIYRLGYRYRLHCKALPGKPDLVFKKTKKIIFVNGCYWHMHKCKYGQVKPNTHSEFWEQKRLANVVRDKKNIRVLKKEGWKILVVWECWLSKKVFLENTIINFLKE